MKTMDSGEMVHKKSLALLILAAKCKYTSFSISISSGCELC